MAYGSFFHTQAVTVAIIEIVISTFSLLIISLSTFILMNFKEDILYQLKSVDTNNYTEIITFLESPVQDRVSILLLPVFYFIGELCIAVFLLHSIKEKNYKRCKTYLTINWTLFFTKLCLFTICAIRIGGDCISFYILFGISSLFTLYSVWVVHRLMKIYRSNENKGYRRTPLQSDCFGKL